MIIQHNIPAMNSYRNLNNNQNAIAGNLEKLSSGYQINRAGDNAAGLAVSEKMRSQITGLGAAQNNVADGISLVKTAEGALQEVHDMLNRMTELSTLSANGTFDDDVDRAAYQQEIEQLVEEIDRISESTNFNGINLLDGSMDSSYSGIPSLALTAAAGTSGITPSLVTGGTFQETTYKASDMLGNAAVTLDFGTIGTDGVYSAGTTLTTTAVTDEATFNTAVNAMTAAGLSVSGSWGGTLADSTLTFTTTTAGTSLGEFNVATGDVTSDSVVTVLSPTSQKEVTKADGYEFDFSTAPAVGSYLEIDGIKIHFTDTLGDEAKNGTATDVYVGLMTGDGTSGTKTALTATELAEAVKSALNSATAAGGGSGIDFSDAAVGSGKLTVYGQAAGDAGTSLQLQIGDTSDSFNQLVVDIECMHTSNLGSWEKGTLNSSIADLDISNQKGASEAIDVIKDAINQVSTNRAGLGAIQNRLEHTANNLSVAEENIQDAESTIRDTDVAAEMMEYTKNNILIQSAQSMLAQANQLPQGVLQLLG